MQKFLLVRDGTVPVTLARILHEDGEPPWDGDMVFIEEIGDECQWLGWWWADSDSGSTGFETFTEALQWLQLETVGDVTVGPGHLAVTYGEGDDESYGHIFDVRGYR